jgi:N-acyl-D-amino-acid deacylase
MRTLALILAGTALSAAQGLVIRNAKVVDGTGAPARRAEVRIEKGRIAAVGPRVARPGDATLDAAGLVLAPGFIDTHNHSDRGLDREPAASSQVSQGITTVLLGADGSSAWPLAEWFEKRRRNPAALNTAMTAGHATIRTKVMGDDFKRAARPDEVAAMVKLTEQAMREGAAGLSSGLEYEIGSYAATEELIAMARVVGRFQGLYISHVRDEADRAFEAFAELVRIAREAKVAAQISHMKLGTAGVWGKAAEAVKLVNDARRARLDVTADVYPYEAWASTITVLIPNKRYDDPASVARGLADVGGAQNITVVSYAPNPAWEFRSMADIAQAEGITPVELFIRIVRNGGAGVVCKSMLESDMKVLYAQPWTMISSDGGIGMRHPRGAGTYPRFLGRYVREQQWMPLETAIHKMTALPAARLKLKDRGRIRAGFAADLVLFDERSILDRSTFLKPFELSEGVQKVWVNGELVWSDGAVTGRLPGKVLTR